MCKTKKEGETATTYKPRYPHRQIPALAGAPCSIYNSRKVRIVEHIIRNGTKINPKTIDTFKVTTQSRTLDFPTARGYTLFKEWAPYRGWRAAPLMGPRSSCCFRFPPFVVNFASFSRFAVRYRSKPEKRLNLGVLKRLLIFSRHPPSNTRSWSSVVHERSGSSLS